MRSSAPILSADFGLFDLGLLGEVEEVLLHALVRERVLELRSLAFVGREELSRTLGVELHDVEAVLRADRRLGDFARLQSREGHAEGGLQGEEDGGGGGSGAAGGAASTFFFSVSRVTSRINKNIENAIMRKSKVVCKKFP